MELSTKLERLRMIFTTRRVASECGAKTPKSILDWQASPGSIKADNVKLINAAYTKYNRSIVRKMKEIERLK